MFKKKNTEPLLNLTKPFKVAAATTEPSNPKASPSGKKMGPGVKFTQSTKAKK